MISSTYATKTFFYILVVAQIKTVNLIICCHHAAIRRTASGTTERV